MQLGITLSPIILSFLTLFDNEPNNFEVPPSWKTWKCSQWRQSWVAAVTISAHTQFSFLQIFEFQYNYHNKKESQSIFKTNMNNYHLIIITLEHCYEKGKIVAVTRTINVLSLQIKVHTLSLLATMRPWNTTNFLVVHHPMS